MWAESWDADMHAGSLAHVRQCYVYISESCYFEEPRLMLRCLQLAAAAPNLTRIWLAIYVDESIPFVCALVQHLVHLRHIYLYCSLCHEDPAENDAEDYDAEDPSDFNQVDAVLEVAQLVAARAHPPLTTLHVASMPPSFVEYCAAAVRERGLPVELRPHEPLDTM